MAQAATITEAQLRRVLQYISTRRHALRDRELVPYYQPVVNLRHFTIRGYEALIRWNHPQRGLVLPGEFGVRLEDHFYMTEQGPRWFTEPALAIDQPFS